METTETVKEKSKEKIDFLPIIGTDYVQLYVGNAKQAAYYYKTAFGFQDWAYEGLETGVRSRTSYVLKQGEIILILTSSLHPGTNISGHVDKHGDGVTVYAFRVADAEKSFNESVKRGAKPFLEPSIEKDKYGEIKLSGIRTYGDTRHIFIERKNYQGKFLPGFEPFKSNYNPPEVGLKYIDHCVGNVGWGEMNIWAEFYEKILGFTNLITFDDKDISTEHSALMSKVMQSSNGRIKFPINEPAKGKKKSQIEEYVEYYHGAGVQHLALTTDNIIFTVSELKKRGIEFLCVPDYYYDTVTHRCGKIDEDLKTLKKLGILVDKDEDGYLLQIFTKPVEDRPTLFYEIIQRKGAKSFGKGNFKALFESLETEQAKRGNL